MKYPVKVNQSLGCQLNQNSQLSVNAFRHFAILPYKLFNLKVKENLVEKKSKSSKYSYFYKLYIIFESNTEIFSSVEYGLFFFFSENAIHLVSLFNCWHLLPPTIFIMLYYYKSLSGSQSTLINVYMKMASSYWIGLFPVYIQRLISSL